MLQHILSFDVSSQVEVIQAINHDRFSVGLAPIDEAALFIADKSYDAAPQRPGGAGGGAGAGAGGARAAAATGRQAAAHPDGADGMGVVVSMLNSELSKATARIRALNNRLEEKELTIEDLRRQIKEQAKELAGIKAQAATARGAPATQYVFLPKTAAPFSEWPQTWYDRASHVYREAMSAFTSNDTGIFRFPPPAPRCGARLEAHTMPEFWVFLPHKSRHWATQSGDKPCTMRVECADGSSKLCGNTLSAQKVHQTVLPLLFCDRVVWVITEDYRCMKNQKVTHSPCGWDPELLDGMGLHVPWRRSAPVRGSFLIHVSAIEYFHHGYSRSSASLPGLLRQLLAMHQATLVSDWAAFLSSQNAVDRIANIARPLGAFLYNTIADPMPPMRLYYDLPDQKTLARFLKEVADSIQPAQDAMMSYFATTTTMMSMDHVYSANSRVSIRLDANGRRAPIGRCMLTVVNQRKFVIMTPWLPGESYQLVENLFAQFRQLIGNDALIRAVWVDKCCGPGGVRNALMGSFPADANGNVTQVKLDLYHSNRRLSSACARNDPDQRTLITAVNNVRWEPANQQPGIDAANLPPSARRLKQADEQHAAILAVTQSEPWRTRLATAPWQPLRDALERMLQHVKNGCLSDPVDAHGAPINVAYTRAGETLTARGSVANESLHRNLSFVGAGKFSTTGALLMLMCQRSIVTEWNLHRHWLDLRDEVAGAMQMQLSSPRLDHFLPAEFACLSQLQELYFVRRSLKARFPNTWQGALINRSLPDISPFIDATFSVTTPMCLPQFDNVVPSRLREVTEAEAKALVSEALKHDPFTFLNVLSNGADAPAGSFNFADPATRHIARAQRVAANEAANARLAPRPGPDNAAAAAAAAGDVAAAADAQDDAGAIDETAPPPDYALSLKQPLRELLLLALSRFSRVNGRRNAGAVTALWAPLKERIVRVLGKTVQLFIARDFEYTFERLFDVACAADSFQALEPSMVGTVHILLHIFAALTASPVVIVEQSQRTAHVFQPASVMWDDSAILRDGDNPERFFC